MAWSLLAVAAAAHAEGPPPLQIPAYGPRSDLLAANGVVPAVLAASTADAAPPPTPWLTGRNAHQVLGLGTLALVGLTGLTAPHGGCEQNCGANTAPRQTSGTPHTRFARAASVFAAATVTSGLLVHWNDFHLEDGFSDPDNQHVMLGMGGALAMLYAVNKSMHSAVPTQHAGTAALGGVAMAISVKLTW
jgi:hypothetical protein